MRAALLGLFLLLAMPAAALSRTVADTVYFNGRVETLDAHFHRARALAVAGDRIVAVGSELEMLFFVGRGTRFVDLRGRALLPGFIDAHAHWLNDFDLAGYTIDEAQDLAIAGGITSVANLFVNSDIYDDLTAYAASGALHLRAGMYLVFDGPCGNVVGDWFLAHPPLRDPSALLRVLGVKIFADGGSCGTPAVTFNFIGLDPPMGDLWLDQATMNAAVALADTNGYQVAIHAIGDRARDVAISAIASVLAGRPNVLRHRIEHNSYTRPDQIVAMRAAGIVPTVWMPSTCAVNRGESTLNATPPENQSWGYAWQSFLAAGLQPAWHSDWPYREASAIHHLYGLATARQVDSDGSDCEPPDFLAGEAVGVRAALRMMTLGSAYALGLETVAGSLEPGKFADLIVLDRDPLDVPIGEVRDLQVLSTVIGGTVRHCTAASVCP